LADGLGFISVTGEFLSTDLELFETWRYTPRLKASSEIDEFELDAAELSQAAPDHFWEMPVSSAKTRLLWINLI
jgi:hypothetical protein